MRSSTALEVYQPFVLAAVSILKETAGVTFSKKSVYVQYGKISTGGTAVSIEISGGIQGRIIYDFSRDFTMRISSRMISANQIFTSGPQEYRIILESALQELANMISAKVMNMVQGYYDGIQISTPKIFLGKDYKLLERADKIIVIDLASPFGDFSINLNFQQPQGVQQ